MSEPLTDFLRGRIDSWSGLEAAMGSLLTEMGGSAPVLLRGRIGDPPTSCWRLSLPTHAFRSGLFAWQRDGQVLALEGCLPGDSDGNPLLAPELPEPDAAYPFALGSGWLADAERVFAGRGLAVRVNPENGLLLGLVGFAPTTAADYTHRLRPVQTPTRFLARSGVGG